MLITSAGTMLQADGFDRVRHQDIEVLWDGFVFMPGLRAGLPTINRLVELLTTSEEVPFGELFGAFVLVIRRRSGSTTVLTDNSGMRTLFISDAGISTEFLPLVRHLHVDSGRNLKLCSEAVAEAYSLGRVLSHLTPIEQIVLSSKSDYYVVENGSIAIRTKAIPDIDGGPKDVDIPTFFDFVRTAIGDDRVSVALTGGYDSRMVFVLLKDGESVIPTLCGDNERHPDPTVARQVAAATGRNLRWVETPKPQITDKVVRDYFALFDGSPFFVDTASFRLAAFYKQLASEGINLHITGDGGVLHKDWEWTQDLPFYHKKKTNLHRFYRDRLAYNFDSRDAGPMIEQDLATLKERTVASLRQYLRSINTQSYDLLYYHVNGRRELYYSARVQGVTLYAPLLEKDLVAFSYALPRRRRFFNNNIRSVITQRAPRVARIPTAYGMTASDEAMMLGRDIFYQIADYAKKGNRWLGRRVGLNCSGEAVTLWSVDEDLRRLTLASESVDFCRRAGILDSNARVESLSMAHLRCSLQMYLLSLEAGIHSSP